MTTLPPSGFQRLRIAQQARNRATETRIEIVANALNDPALAVRTIDLMGIRTGTHNDVMEDRFPDWPTLYGECIPDLRTISLEGLVQGWNLTDEVIIGTAYYDKRILRVPEEVLQTEVENRKIIDLRAFQPPHIVRHERVDRFIVVMAGLFDETRRLARRMKDNYETYFPMTGEVRALICRRADRIVANIVLYKLRKNIWLRRRLLKRLAETAQNENDVWDQFFNNGAGERYHPWTHGNGPNGRPPFPFHASRRRDIITLHNVMQIPCLSMLRDEELELWMMSEVFYYKLHRVMDVDLWLQEDDMPYYEALEEREAMFGNYLNTLGKDDMGRKLKDIIVEGRLCPLLSLRNRLSLYIDKYQEFPYLDYIARQFPRAVTDRQIERFRSLENSEVVPASLYSDFLEMCYEYYLGTTLYPQYPEDDVEEDDDEESFEEERLSPTTPVVAPTNGPTEVVDLTGDVPVVTFLEPRPVRPIVANPTVFEQQGVPMVEIITPLRAIFNYGEEWILYLQGLLGNDNLCDLLSNFTLVPIAPVNDATNSISLAHMMVIKALRWRKIGEQPFAFIQTFRDRPVYIEVRLDSSLTMTCCCTLTIYLKDVENCEFASGDGKRGVFAFELPVEPGTIPMEVKAMVKVFQLLKRVRFSFNHVKFILDQEEIPLDATTCPYKIEECCVCYEPCFTYTKQCDVRHSLCYKCFAGIRARQCQHIRGRFRGNDNFIRRHGMRNEFMVCPLCRRSIDGLHVPNFVPCNFIDALVVVDPIPLP